MDKLPIDEEVPSPNAVHPVGTCELHAPEDLPALAALGINASDLIALARQGFVHREQRGARTHFKLRFRRNGRQAVKYVGSASTATDVRMELDRLQAATRLRRRLNAARLESRQRLRDAKRVLEPLIQARGYKFHGRTIRQTRSAKVAPSK